MKVLDKKFSNFLSFLKTVVNYPLDTIREKRADFQGACAILGVLLAVFVISALTGFYQLSLRHHVTTWTGTILSIEARPSKIAGEAGSNIVTIDRMVGDTREVFEFTVPPATAANLKKGMPARKMFFYTEVVFGDEGISFSTLSADILFLIIGLFLLAFVIVCGSSFITIIFASIFMVKSKYPKKH